MLQYGDNTSPLKKNSPSVGYKELFFDSLNESIIQLPLTLQY